MIRRPPRSTLSSSSAASDVYKRQVSTQSTGRQALRMAQKAVWSGLHKPVLFIMSNTISCTVGTASVPTGFWLQEVATPLMALRRSGRAVMMATPKGGLAPVDPDSLARDRQNADCAAFLADDTLQGAVTETHRLDQVSVDSFSAVFIPGGYGLLWDLPEDPHVQALLTQFASDRKPIAAVCHGVWALRNARLSSGIPLLQGTEYTCFTDREQAACGFTDVVPFSMQAAAEDLKATHLCKADFEPLAITSQCTNGGFVITGQNANSSRLVANHLNHLLEMYATLGKLKSTEPPSIEEHRAHMIRQKQRSKKLLLSRTLSQGTTHSMDFP
eukprot:TRINITY_DN11830_c0_g1_i1.p1 TRINITY_DN11830_c0_g1~~TRINITY_DN11830_c0_g1_i1.p1  ORF type:complete len:329 (+),score=69.10 TRINITY_DN11830_c0_g1_i1:68-1054(+)